MKKSYQSISPLPRDSTVNQTINTTNLDTSRNYLNDNLRQTLIYEDEATTPKNISHGPIMFNKRSTIRRSKTTAELLQDHMENKRKVGQYLKDLQKKKVDMYDNKHLDSIIIEKARK